MMTPKILLSMLAPPLGLTVLALCARLPDKYEFRDPFLEQQKWRLKDAILLLTPFAILASLSRLRFLDNDLWQYLSFLSKVIALKVPIILVATGILYYLVMRVPYRTTLKSFGLDRASFLSKGVPALNIINAVFLVLWLQQDPVEIVEPDPSIAAMLPTLGLGDILRYETSVLVGWVVEELLLRGAFLAPLARKVGKWKAVPL